MRRILHLPLVCPRFARGFTAHLRERRDHQLHQLHVNLYQFYYFIWLLLVTKKQSISNRSLWPFFSAPFLSLIYPWVFSAGFLYRGYSATCRALAQLRRSVGWGGIRSCALFWKGSVIWPIYEACTNDVDAAYSKFEYLGYPKAQRKTSMFSFYATIAIGQFFPVLLSFPR